VPAFVTIDGERRKITKREAVVHQLVNKSATADLRATKMLFDMIKDVEQKATSPRRCPNLVGSMRRTRRWCKSWPRWPQEISRRRARRKRDCRFPSLFSLSYKKRLQLPHFTTEPGKSSKEVFPS
jgi:hypothetical protein